MERDGGYVTSITDTEDAYKIMQEASEYLDELWNTAGVYHALAEGFLNPDNIRKDGRYDLSELENHLEQDISVEKLNQGHLHDYSTKVSEKIERERNLRHRLDAIKFSELSDHRFIDGEKVDITEMPKQVEKLLDEYRQAEEAIWRTDMRLRNSSNAEFNLTEMRLKKSRRSYRSSERDEDISTAFDRLFAD